MKKANRISRRRTWGIGPKTSTEVSSSYVVVSLPEGENVQVSKNISSLGWALTGRELAKAAS